MMASERIGKLQWEMKMIYTLETKLVILIHALRSA